jgi:N-acetylmuramic acid 6-phosphate etherase/N-acetylglucosamine-6-phosphate deacetylase
MIISAPRLFLGEHFTGPGGVEIADGRIVRVFAGETHGGMRLTHGFLAPGLIDLHNNGAFGVDFCTATPEDWDSVMAGLGARGVTSVLPTAITAPIPVLQAAARGVAAAQARHPGILGLHLEGPFLAGHKRGAHLAEFLCLPEGEALEAILALAPRLVTLAPELPGALAAIRRLRDAGVLVALGHTAADAAQMRDAAEAGASIVTHVFNAMGGLGHRDIGAPGVALTDQRLSPCLITDGVHVAPEILLLAFAACPRAIAVTDSILLAGLAAGASRSFGSAGVRLDPRGVGVREDGTIAGAGIILDEAVRRLIGAGVAPETALAAATARPAAALGLDDRGMLAPGMRADLVWFSDDCEPLQSWTSGAPTAAAKPRGTEIARPELMDLEARPTGEIVHLFLAQETAAQRALAVAAPALARLIDGVAARMQAGGRLFYAGAGTSGRLGLLDAVECGPTFGVDAGVIVPLLAGGPGAFIQAAEGAEDDEDAARAALAAQNFGANDALVGIAASGATPFTLAALREASARDGLTGAIVNNAGSPVAEAADIAVEIVTGPEIIAGSTRLSAGTAQKVALNILSSAVMIRLGKTYGPYMVDMRATNAKLKRRAVRMVQAVCDVPEAEAMVSLAACDNRVKVAIVMLRCAVTAAEAKSRLEATGGSVRQALNAQDVKPR